MSVIKYCPKQFIEHDYFTNIFNQIFDIYDKLEEPQVLIDKIAISGQIDKLNISHLSFSVQWGIQKSIYKSKYLVKFLKTGIKFDNLIINLNNKSGQLDKKSQGLL